MTRDIHYVVNAAEQPDVTILINLGTVSREVLTFVARPIGFAIPIGVSPDSTQHCWPRPRECQIAATMSHGNSVIINDCRADPRQWKGCRAGFGRNHARQRGDHLGARLGLPPRIHDGTALSSDHFVVPHPGLWVNRLPNGSQ